MVKPDQTKSVKLVRTTDKDRRSVQSTRWWLTLSLGELSLRYQNCLVNYHCVASAVSNLLRQPLDLQIVSSQRRKQPKNLFLTFYTNFVRTTYSSEIWYESLPFRFQNLNKRVILRERKRHTARRVASARYAGWGGGTPSSHGGGGVTPSSHGGGYLGYPPPSRPGWGTPTIQTWLGYSPTPQTWDGALPPEMVDKWKHYLPSSFGCGR